MINRVTLEGRLTKDPERKKTQSGTDVCMFTLAVDRNSSKQKDDNRQTVDFISCVAWKQSAEYLSAFGNKGSLVVLEGRIQTRNYEGSDGRKVYVTEVVADHLSVYDTRKKDKTGIANKADTVLYKTDVKADKHIALEGYTEMYGGENIDPDDLPF